MKINKEDIICSNSMTFKLLQEMTDYSQYLRKKAERMDELNCMIVNYINAGIITDTRQIDCARSWYNHSDLTAQEIINMVIKRDDE